MSLLIGDIYDASLDETLWPRAFDRIWISLANARRRSFRNMRLPRNPNVYFMLGHEQDYVDTYLERYARMNPLFPTLMFSEVEQTQTIPDVMPQHEFCQTRFTKEWCIPQGICDAAISIVDKSASGATAFITMRRMREGFVDDEMRRRFSLIVPHVRRACSSAR